MSTNDAALRQMMQNGGIIMSLRNYVKEEKEDNGKVTRSEKSMHSNAMYVPIGNGITPPNVKNVAPASKMRALPAAPVAGKKQALLAASAAGKTPCKNGVSCPYLARGKCKFLH